MANAKQILIEATVPYNWASQLTDQEARTFSSFLLAPTGFRHGYRAGTTWIDLDAGKPGQIHRQLTMYSLYIEGVEAIWHDTLKLIVRTLARQEHATITRAMVRDLDAPSGWEAIVWRA